MRGLWNVVSFMAVVNLLAIGIFAGWLLSGDRLSRDRVLRVREVFATTLTEEAEAAAARAAEQAAALEQEQAGARREDPPLPSGEQVRQTWMVSDQARQAIDRLRAETGQHQAVLSQRSGDLDRREQELEERERAWRQSIADEAQRKIDAQFQKTVRLYESLAGKQAKRMLLELVAAGNVDQAVAYVDAMGNRPAAKTLKELKTDEENRLATELLERLRMFGIEAVVSENAGLDGSSPIPQ